MKTIPETAAVRPEDRLSEVVCIVDRSGSMHDLAADAIGGYNTFLQAQKDLPGRAHFSLVLFDHEVQRVDERVPLAEGRPLDETTFVPRGTTALFDAVGSTITRITEAIGLGPASEHPEKVVVAIMTDGLENASTEWTGRAVRQLVKQRQAAGWEFVFLAAGLDAVAEAEKIGIVREDAFSFGTSKAETRLSYEVLHEQVSLKRGLMRDANDEPKP